MEGPESAKDALEVDYLDKKQKGHWIVVRQIKMSFPEKRVKSMIQLPFIHAINICEDKRWGYIMGDNFFGLYSRWYELVFVSSPCDAALLLCWL